MVMIVAAMLCDIVVVVVVVVVRMHPRVIPLAILLQGKRFTGFYEYGAPLSGLLGRRSSAIIAKFGGKIGIHFLLGVVLGVTVVIV